MARYITFEEASGGAYSPDAAVSYIREAAKARGIDPDVAVRVAQSEGLNQYTGDAGTSFGPFQLHYGSGGRGFAQAGMGNDFTAATGLDARDPATWKQQIDFALDQAKQKGWKPWYGAARAGIAPTEGLSIPDRDTKAARGQTPRYITFEEASGIVPEPVAGKETIAPKGGIPRVAQPRNYALSDVPRAALQNLPANAEKVAGQFAEAASHPTETIKALGKTLIGMAEELVPGQQQYETEYADPFYRNLAHDLGFRRDEKGNIIWDKEQLKRNLAERPAEMALTASTIAAPVESMPGRIGQIARVADPIYLAGKTASTVAKAPIKVAKETVGHLTSGMGPEAISEAYRSGKVGGTEGEAFRAQMRGYGDPNAPVDMANKAITELRKERAAEYTKGMRGIASDSTVLDFKPIDDAFANANKVRTFKGISLNKSTQGIRQEIADTLHFWKQLDPKEYHTAAGFDALKQMIADIGERFPYGSAERRAVGEVVSAIREQINKQAPEYANVMKAYERASNILDEFKNSLSLKGSKTNYDTALRKLQSVLRNNAFTNWTARAKLAELVQKKVPELMPSLSGQSASTWMPRGLPAKLVTGMEGLLGLAAHGGAGGFMAAVVANPLVLIPMLAGLAASSPRIVGEVTHAAGRLARVGGEAEKVTGPLSRGVIAATPREVSIEHAEKVLSPQVVQHIAENPNTKRAYEAWLYARENGKSIKAATKSLASSIGKELGHPELVARIYRELMASPAEQ